MVMKQVKKGGARFSASSTSPPPPPPFKTHPLISSTVGVMVGSTVGGHPLKEAPRPVAEKAQLVLEAMGVKPPSVRTLRACALYAAVQKETLSCVALQEVITLLKTDVEEATTLRCSSVE